REVEKQGTCIHFQLGIPGVRPAGCRGLAWLGSASLDPAVRRRPALACMCFSSPPCTPRLRVLARMLWCQLCVISEAS
uniref:Uncharacterized protein n=1 Tax=Triticum urartu TaxID=4572 RepID=A0A8R7K2Q5_TRIUA